MLRGRAVLLGHCRQETIDRGAARARALGGSEELRISSIEARVLRYVVDRGKG